MFSLVHPLRSKHLPRPLRCLMLRKETGNRVGRRRKLNRFVNLNYAMCACIIQEALEMEDENGWKGLVKHLLARLGWRDVCECAFDSVQQIGCTKRLVTKTYKQMKKTTDLEVGLECSSVFDGDALGRFWRTYGLAGLPIEHARDGRLDRTRLVKFIHMLGSPS
jgi:hypothetical protein